MERRKRLVRLKKGRVVWIDPEPPKELVINEENIDNIYVEKYGVGDGLFWWHYTIKTAINYNGPINKNREEIIPNNFVFTEAKKSYWLIYFIDRFFSSIEKFFKLTNGK